MPDQEEALGQPETAPVTQTEEATEPVAPEAAETEEGQAPETEPKEQPPATKYGGKSPEELAAELAEKDRVIASIYQDRAKQEHESQILRALADTGTAPSQGGMAPTIPSAPYPQAPIPGAPGPQFAPFDPKRIVTEEEYLRDPMGSENKIFVAREQYNQAIRSVYENQRRAELAQGNFLKGRQEAAKAAPKLLVGIESRVDNELVNSYRRGQIDYQQLGDPKTHLLVAELVRRDMGELNFEKYYKPSPTPMTAVSTEKPTKGPAAKPKVQLTAEQRELVEMWGTPLDRFTQAYEREKSEG